MIHRYNSHLILLSYEATPPTVLIIRGGAWTLSVFFKYMFLLFCEVCKQTLALCILAQLVICCWSWGSRQTTVTKQLEQTQSICMLIFLILYSCVAVSTVVASKSFNNKTGCVWFMLPGCNSVKSKRSVWWSGEMLRHRFHAANSSEVWQFQRKIILLVWKLQSDMKKRTKWGTQTVFD